MEIDKMSTDYYGPHGSDAAAAASSRWLTEDVNKLIELVKRDEAIYNPRHKYYFCRPYVENFWREVDQKLEKNPGASLAKWTNLRISFRREYTNFVEEKVAPCWSYFDRMYFLRDFLRKKIQPMRDDQFQEILKVRMQQETSKAMTTTSRCEHTPTSQISRQLDNLLIYFDEQNNSETDELGDEVQQVPTADIKTEVEDNMDDYMVEQERHVVDDEDEEEQQQQEDAAAARQQTVVDNFNERAAAGEALNFSILNESRPISRHSSHYNRMRVQPYARTQSTHAHINTILASNVTRPSGNTSFLNTNFTTRESMAGLQDTVPGTTNSQANIGTTENAASSTQHLLSNATHPRLEISTISSGVTAAAAATSCATPMSTAISFATATSTTTSLPATNAFKDLCSCKTDPDAMFLMSLLPDMQKLNGRERGNVKIAFQNILQKSLYP